jgi:hypothetical protein
MECIIYIFIFIGNHNKVVLLKKIVRGKGGKGDACTRVAQPKSIKKNKITASTGLIRAIPSNKRIKLPHWRHHS